MISFNKFIKEGILNPAFKKNEYIKQLKNIVINTKDKSEKKEAIEDFYNNMLPFFKDVENKLKKLLKKSLSKKDQQVKILTDIKKPDSIFNKYIERGKNIMEMNDIVRSAILFKEKEDVNNFINKFLRKNKNVVKDYEKKEKGGDPEFGYFGSHHIDININGLICEIQVMTRKLWNYKIEAHKIYQKARTSGGDDFYKKVSKDIFKAANESITYNQIEFDEEELEDMDCFIEINIDEIEIDD